MDLTPLHLLKRAQGGAEGSAWHDLLELYQPLIRGWLRARSTPSQDAEDLTQEVLAVVVRELPRFAHNGRPGAFRAWLRAVTANRLRVYWRSGKAPAPTGDVLNWADQLADDTSELSQRLDRQHDDYLLVRMLQRMEQEFEPTTMKAFRRVTLDGVKPEDVAQELKISVAAVYIAKSRLLRRLRETASEWLEREDFF